MKGQRFENGVFPVSSQKQDYLCKTLSLAYKGSKRGGMEKCGQDMKKYRSVLISLMRDVDPKIWP